MGLENTADEDIPRLSRYESLKAAAEAVSQGHAQLNEAIGVLNRAGVGLRYIQILELCANLVDVGKQLSTDMVEEARRQ